MRSMCRIYMRVRQESTVKTHLEGMGFFMHVLYL